MTGTVNDELGRIYRLTVSRLCLIKEVRPAYMWAPQPGSGPGLCPWSKGAELKGALFSPFFPQQWMSGDQLFPVPVALTVPLNCEPEADFVQVFHSNRKTN